MPEAVAGYSGGYLATLLLPLVENAVEASPIGGEIIIDYEESKGYFTILIINDLVKPTPEPVFPPDGSSTKHAGPGLGLSVARRLAGMQRGGRIDTSVSGGLA